jgi:hypothetical protein
MCQNFLYFSSFLLPSLPSLPFCLFPSLPLPFSSSLPSFLLFRFFLNFIYFYCCAWGTLWHFINVLTTYQMYHS